MSRDFVTSGWIAFANVEIDVTGHRLLVNGEEVALERKAFSVLVLLARSPGRVFSRDEILDAVWGHNHVTPGVLNRIVTLLRHALGESAGDAHFLSTVHGVGYRFDAQVRDVEHRPAPSATADMLAASSSETANVDPGLAEAVAPVPLDPVDIPSPRPRRRTRSRLVVLACVGLLLLGVSIFWRTRQVASAPQSVSTAASMSVSAPAPGGSSFLVVMPMRVIGGTTADAAFADGIDEELVSLLARVEGLRVMARTSATTCQHLPNASVSLTPWREACVMTEPWCGCPCA